MYTAQLRVYPPEHISSLSTEPTFAPSQMYANDKMTDIVNFNDGRRSEKANLAQLAKTTGMGIPLPSNHRTLRLLLPSRFGYSSVYL